MCSIDGRCSIRIFPVPYANGIQVPPKPFPKDALWIQKNRLWMVNVSGPKWARFALTTSLPCDTLRAWQNLLWDAVSARCWAATRF
jgi:hypothetical protein